MGLWGRVLLFLCLSSIGITMGTRVHKRRELLLLSSQLLGTLSAELTFCQKSADALILELAAKSPFDSLGYLRKFCSLPKAPFPKRWKQAVEQSVQDGEDREMLLLVGQVLGAYDLNTQLKELCQLREKMAAKAQELLEEDIRERRLYTAFDGTGSLHFNIKDGIVKMDVDLIFKIAAIGIIVSVLNQVLIRSGREEQATMTTLAGLIVVLMMMIEQISLLFDTVKTVFGL